MEISFFQTYETYAAYASVLIRKNKGARGTYFIGLAVMAAGALFKVFADMGTSLFVVGLYLCITIAWREKTYAAVMYKNAPRYTLDQQMTWRFENEYFSCFSPLCNATYRYETVSKILENSRIIALYVGEGSALLLDKRGMHPGQTEQLRSLLAARTGRPAEWVKDSGDRRVLLTAVAVVAAIALGVTGFFGGMLLRDRVPRTITGQGYSIRVVQGFEERPSDYYDLAADWEEKLTYLTVSWYPADAAFSQRELLRGYAEGAENYTWGVLTDGSPTLTFDWDDGYRYFISAAQGSDGWWVTEFCCPQERAEEMLPRFAGWADTVSVK